MKKYFIYILLLSNNQYYIGSSNNIDRRIHEHNAGKTLSIKYKLPAKLIFYQQFATLVAARKAELAIKRQKSRKYIEEIIKRGTV